MFAGSQFYRAARSVTSQCVVFGLRMPKSKSKTTKKRRRKQCKQPQGNQQAELIVMLPRRASLLAFFSHLGIFDRLALTVLFSSSLS